MGYCASIRLLFRACVGPFGGAGVQGGAVCLSGGIKRRTQPRSFSIQARSLKRFFDRHLKRPFLAAFVSDNDEEERRMPCLEVLDEARAPVL